MRTVRHFILPGLASLLFAACGGGGGDDDDRSPPDSKGSFTAVVSFGDSLSDVGSYAPATSLAGNGQPPYFGGKFTTNETSDGTPDSNSLGKVWVEDLARSLGITITPAEVGFAGSSVKCPAAANPALAASCTGYAQGGAYVSDPDGIGKEDGALTVPVVQQIDNHLARFGSFKPSDLVLVYAGNNDVLAAIAYVALVDEDAQAQVAAGTLGAAAAQQQVDAAKADAQKVVRQSADALGDAVKSKILGRGGVYVAVVLLSDIGDSPLGGTFDATVKAAATLLAQTFNEELTSRLHGEPVGTIDAFTLFKDVYANPAAYGIVNNTTPACSVDKISALTSGSIDDGSSLFCNATPGAPYNGLTDGADVTTWQFADDLHPTTGGHQIIADLFAARLRALGWI